MTGQVLDKVVESLGPTEYVVHNKFRVFSVINRQLAGVGKFLSSEIKIMNKDNKNDRSIEWAERHHSPSIFGTIRAGKSKFGTRRFGDTDLVVTRDGIHQPSISVISKFSTVESQRWMGMVMILVT